MQQQIVIGAVTRKEGTSKKTGKPWTKYVVHAQDSDTTFETFDSAVANNAHENIGKQAIIEFTAGQYGNDLTSMAVDEFSSSHPVANGSLPSSDAADGGPDWDLIGLRKTRCLLWAHLLGSDAFWALRATMTEAQHYAIGSKLVEVAESDIYWREPAMKDAAIPF